MAEPLADQSRPTLLTPPREQFPPLSLRDQAWVAVFMAATNLRVPYVVRVPLWNLWRLSLPRTRRRGTGWRPYAI